MYALKTMPVGFPGLFGDWELNIDPVALNVGNGVYWYGIIIGLGLVLGAMIAMKMAPKVGLTEDHVLDMVLWAAPLAIIGARIYYVIFYLSLFQDADGSYNFGKMIAIWDGGIAIYGAVISAFIVVFVFCKLKKIPFATLTDVGVIGLLLGQGIGRWGNFVNREAFGDVTTLPWRMKLYTSLTETIEVHPTFFYESMWNLIGVLLMVFVVIKLRRFDGEVTWFYFLWYGLGRVWIEGLRTDSLYLFDWTLLGEPIRVSQALSFVMIVVSASALWYMLKVKKVSSETLFVNRKTVGEAEQETAVVEESAQEFVAEPMENPVVEAASAETIQTQEEENQ
ncbi:prolipoprotein diacylglyceryl transferase [Bengtsoniella intestinalis]|uniref:prolipoprotein diacylglyceryl transferase n=1 Tax=Bengtsoniella intestinalis TaxID=3073143 RepID=UPI00391FC2CA